MAVRFYITIAVLCLCAASASAQRWAQATLPAPYDEGYYLDIYFLPSNTQYGWACDNDSGFVVRTTNGGQTWQGTRVTATGYCHLEYIQFLNTTTGYCSGPCGVFKSTDGGASWAALNLGVPDSLVWGGWFKSTTEGWVTGGGCGHNNFYHTTDGGSSWSRYQDTVIKRSNLSDPLWQADMSAGEVYAIGNGTLWKSTDDGANWAVESYTGTTSPWHEEIARYGSTFLVACAGSNCKLDYTSGGMRWSHDDGATWNVLDIGTDMFGCFLLNNQTAWASGRSGNVWFTANGGTQWTRRDCGLNGKHMDDIFFINDSTGWVVGDGLFYLDRAKRTVTDSALEFLGACPDSTLRDTVWVTNENFLESPWTIELVGDDAWMYRVANVVPKPMPACSNIPVIVEYKANLGGRHSAQMHIKIQQPDTLIVVDLHGQRRTLNAYPTDTLFVFNQKVGIPISRILEWRATALPIEQIVNIQRDSGSAVLDLVSAFPQPINIIAPVCQTPITGTLTDTGWVAAHFRVTLAPCMRDTMITVRVYGTSGIINAPKTASATLNCIELDTIKIPVANTGNANLIIYSAALTGLSPEVFTVIGMRNAGKTAPWTIAPGAADTLILVVKPTGKMHQAVLQINNDDGTTTRGDVQPWEVALTITAVVNPNLKVQPEIIDLGIVCLTSSIDTTFTVSNQNAFDNTYSVQSIHSNIKLNTAGTRVIREGRTNTERFTYTANQFGSYTDTMYVVSAPCQAMYPVIVKVMVVDQVVNASPNPLIDSTIVGKPLTRFVTIKNVSLVPVTITSLTLNPTDAEVSLAATLPTTIAVADSMQVQITWTPSTIKTAQYDIVVETEGLCASTGHLELRSISNAISVSKNKVDFDLGCNVIVSIDSVVVSAKGAPVSFDMPRLASNNPAITILRPSQPFIVDPLNPVTILVSYDPTKQRNASDTLLLEMTDGTGTLQIPIHGSSTYTSWRVHRDSIAYTTDDLCDTTMYATIIVENLSSEPLTVTNQNSLTPSWLLVKTLQGLPAFPLVVDGYASDTLVVECWTSLMPSRSATTTIDLVDAQCSVRKTVYVSANLNGGLLVLSPNPVDAGTVDTGAVVLRQGTVANPYNVDLTIASLVVTSGQDAWTLLSNVAGTTVPALSSVVVDLQFIAHRPGASNGTLLLTQAADHCVVTTSIDLIGRGKFPDVPPRYALLLSAGEKRAIAGERVEIPVTWQSDVSEAGIDSASFTVEYYELLMHADSVTRGNLLDADIATTFVPGRLDVVVKGLGVNAGKPGTIAVISGVASPALPDSTLFVFSNVKVWSRDTVTTSTDPGLLIVDVCGPRNLISLVAPTTMRIAEPLPVNNTLVVEITAPYSERVTIQIVDVQGSSICTYEALNASSGRSVIHVPVSHIPSGAYIIHATTGRGGVFDMPTLIVH